MMKHRIDVMIPEDELQAKVAELGRQITEHYQGTSELVLIGFCVVPVCFCLICAVISICLSVWIL